MSTLMAGCIYFGVVFAVGFVLGTVRIFLLAPIAGETVSVAVELPLMLVVSWIACSKVVTHFNVPKTVFSRLVMGTLAFALLMIAEISLATVVMAQSLSFYLINLTSTHGILGLTGQIMFGLFPIVQLKQRFLTGRGTL